MTVTLSDSSTLEAWRSAELSKIYPVAFTEFYDSGRPTAYRAGAASRSWIGEPRANSILDVGAGAGRITKHLTLAWYQVGAVEPNPDYCRLLAAAAPKVAVWPSMTEVLRSLGDRSWDVVLSFLVLQHYPSPERSELLRQMFALSRRLVLVQLPLYERPREPARYDDVGTWTKGQLADAAKKSGYIIREARQIPGEYDPDQETPPEHYHLHVLERWKEQRDGEESLATRRPAA